MGIIKTVASGMREDEKILIFGAVVALMLVLAALSTLLNDHAGASNFCGSEFSQQQRYNCLESIAIQANNSTSCALLPGMQRDGCYSQIAGRTDNSTLCGSVSNNTSRYACIMQVANATGRYSLCSQLAEPYSDECLYSIGIRYSSEQACLSISNRSSSNSCSYSLDYASAIAHSNSSYCMGIGNGTYAQSTEILQSQPNLGSKNGGNLPVVVDYYHDYLNITVTPKDLCYYSLAYYTNSSSYCPGISNSSLETLCAETYSKAYSNASSGQFYKNFSSICRNSNLGASACTSSSAIIKAIYGKNITACRSLNSTESAYCIASVASYYSNSSYCQYITNATLNGACIESVLYENNSSIYNAS